MNFYMKQLLFVLAVSFVLWQEVASGTLPPTDQTSTTTTGNTTASTTRQSTAVLSNSTTSGTNISVRANFPNGSGENSGMLERSLYVAIGISSLVAIYFIVRWVKTRGRRKAKKYGVIHGTGGMELQPLEKHTDEDEEDIALFDVKDSKRPK